MFGCDFDWDRREGLFWTKLGGYVFVIGNIEHWEDGSITDKRDGGVYTAMPCADREKEEKIKALHGLR